MPREIRVVKEHGERVSTLPAGVGLTLLEGPREQPRKYTVKPACESKNGGHWYCSTHLKHFENQMQKDSHISAYGGYRRNARHALVWICHEHGPEQA
jgi:hypothetical protein